MWRLRLRTLPTRKLLNERGIDLDSILCPRCGDGIEDSDHVFVGCEEIRNFWGKIGTWGRKDLSNMTSLSQLLEEDEERLERKKGADWWVGIKRAALYAIWGSRNKATFEGVKVQMEKWFFKWQRITYEWMNGRSKGEKVGWVEWLAGHNTC